MNQFSAILYLLLCSLFYSSPVFSQISGVVNQYSEVLSLDYTLNSVEVSNPTSFTTSDRILLIQMKGASMDETNTANFGDIINMNGAGLYEMATVCDVVGNDVLFSYEFENTYSPGNGRVQLINVYSGTDETVNATLSAAPWNGTTGGVVAIELSGTLTLNADIDVSEQGFRGGNNFMTTYICNFAAIFSDYFYPFALNGKAGNKGEGVADFIANKEYGRGHQANGGGGGNDHNAGGGGGSNYATGGLGGTRNVGGIFSCRGNNPGIGGQALFPQAYTLANNQVLLGGGGGAGEDNNGQGVDAGNGGGIIIIIADEIEGNGNSIRSNGATPADAGSDGGSGGGAAGSILLSTNGYGVTALNLEAIGGDGGSSNNATGCEGPGGGGSGGVIWAASGLTGGVTTDVSGGASGIAISCAQANGATAGGNGVVQTALTIPEEIVNLSPCVLNTSNKLFGELTPQKEVRLYWDQLPYDRIANIYLERKNQTGVFLRLAELGLDQSEWIDLAPETGENIYRLKFVNRDASLSYSNQTAIHVGLSEVFDLAVSPNPINRTESLSVNYYLPRKGTVKLSLWDLPGKQILKKELEGEAGNNASFLQFHTLPVGTYFLKVDFQGKSEIQKIFVQN